MAKLIIDAVKQKSQINRNIYGHFAEHLGRCIYNGIYVGESSPIPNIQGMRADIIAALRNIRIPVLRWPGGCFADEYHWQDGIGPTESRKKMINTHWGGVTEDNSFGTHEFMELCRQLDCEAYICGNVGSGTVQELSNWVEYLNFDGVSPMADLRRINGQAEAWAVRYFGVGNENWGCGGNMRPEYYADVYRRYQTYVRNYGDKKIFRIACGASGDDYRWTEVLMEQAGRYMDGLALHYYTGCKTWQGKRSAKEFDADVYFDTLKNTLKMGQLLERHGHIMDQFDPEKRVALVVDEWGSWHDVEPGTNPGFLYQQNTMRDAMIAAINLNLFNKYSARVRMANIAQTVNVLQAMVLTEGARMLLTPSYHVFDLYKVHQDATLVDSYLSVGAVGPESCRIPGLHESASIDRSGTLNITLCHVDPGQPVELAIDLLGFQATEAEATILQGPMNSHNTFDYPEQIKPKTFSSMTLTGACLNAVMPPCSVVRISLK